MDFFSFARCLCARVVCLVGGWEGGGVLVRVDFLGNDEIPRDPMFKHTLSPVKEVQFATFP